LLNYNALQLRINLKNVNIVCSIIFLYNPYLVGSPVGTIGHLEVILPDYEARGERPLRWVWDEAVSGLVVEEVGDGELLFTPEVGALEVKKKNNVFN
jgi:hypothetical protein